MKRNNCGGEDLTRKIITPGQNGFLIKMTLGDYYKMQEVEVRENLAELNQVNKAYELFRGYYEESKAICDNQADFWVIESQWNRNCEKFATRQMYAELMLHDKIMSVPL